MERLTADSRLTSLQLEVERRSGAEAITYPYSIRSERQALVAIIAISTGLRVLLAGTMDLNYDEAYDVVAARTVELSYFDHPPAIMWLIAAIVHATGSESPLVVRLPTLILFSAQNWILYALTTRRFGARAGLLAVSAISLSPLYSFFIGVVAVTDGPLLFAATAAAYWLVRAFDSDSTNPWLPWSLAGAFFGFALLSKFSAVLLVPGLLVFLLTAPERRRFLATPWPYLAGFFALAVFSPVLVWNLDNNFAAFNFQAGRAGMTLVLHVPRALRHLGFLMLVMGPPIWLGQVWALKDAIVAQGSDSRPCLLAWLAIAPLSFFVVLDLFGETGTEAPHWPALGYLFTFPLLGAAVGTWNVIFPRTVRWTIAIQFTMVTLLVVGFVAHMQTGWIRLLVPSLGAYDMITADQADWDNLRKSLEDRGLLDSDRYFLVASRYYFCFKAQLVLHDRIPVVCLDDNPISHALATYDQAPPGRDALIVRNWWRAPQSLASVLASFESVDSLAPIWLEDHGRPVMRLDLSVGHRLGKAGLPALAR